MNAATFELDAGDGLMLRLDQPADADEIFALIDRDRDDLGRWMPWAQDTRAVSDTRTAIEKSLAQYAAGTDVALAIVEHGRAVGKIGLHGIGEPEGQAELGYWLSSAARGRGVMTRAARRLVDYGFATLKLRRVWLTYDPRNTASRGVAERLGMRHEGTLIEDRADHRGGYRDTAMYAVLREEWEPGVPPFD